MIIVSHFPAPFTPFLDPLSALRSVHLLYFLTLTPKLGLTSVFPLP